MCVVYVTFLLIVGSQYFRDGQLTATMIQYARAGRYMCSATVGPTAVPEQIKIHYAYEARVWHRHPDQVAPLHVHGIWWRPLYFSDLGSAVNPPGLSLL